MKISKLILPSIFIVLIAIMYFLYFVPTDKIGSLSKSSPGSEINQEINLSVVKTKNYERHENGSIISFYAKDKNNVEIKVTSHDSIPLEIADAEVIELLGHMHGNSLVAAKIEIVK